MAASCSHCLFLSSTVAFFWGSLLAIVGLSPTPVATDGPAPLEPGTRPLRRATSALACACLRASISWSRWRLLSERRMLPWWRPVASCCCFSNLVSLTKTSQYLHQYFGWTVVSLNSYVQCASLTVDFQYSAILSVDVEDDAVARGRKIEAGRASQNQRKAECGEAAAEARLPQVTD